MVKIQYSEDKMSAMIAESREACKRLRKLGNIMKTVATHRFDKLRYLRAVEKLATWRSTHGFDRTENGDDRWVHGLLPSMTNQITISMSGKDRSRQKINSFINELDRGTVSFTDEEFARLKRNVGRRGRDAAHVPVVPVDIVQYCSTRSRRPKLSFDARVYMEKNNEGRINPERDQLESPSAGTGFETPGQQYLPNWATDEPLPTATWSPAQVRIWGEAFFPSQNALFIGTRANSKFTTPSKHQTPFSCRRAACLKTRRHPTKKTSSLTPDGKEESRRLEKRVCWYQFLFLGGILGSNALLVPFVFACLSVVFCFLLSGDHFSAS